MAPQRRYRALLIGNASFPEDPHGLPALNGPLVDIRELGCALTDGEVGLFAPRDLKMLPDSDVQDLRVRLDEFFAAANREDVLLLYYSGHGQLDIDNRLHLCAHDTRTGNLRSTALKADDLNDMITACAATSTIVVLDCCHSGAFKGANVVKGITAYDQKTVFKRAVDALRRQGAAGLVTGRGRYVLASSRSTQLAQDTTSEGQLSPFTAQLVRGLREATADGDLTVTELYRQMYHWITESSGPTPQLRFSGEGEVIIACRGSRSLAPSPTPEPPRTLLPPPERGQVWRANRVHTSGVDCILRVTYGGKRHTVEYRSLSRQRAMVLVDGRQVHHGSNLFTCGFRLGRHGPQALLEVTESDLRLSIDGQQVYGLRQAVPDSPDYREELAAAIRATLGTDETVPSKVRLGIVPHVRVDDFRSVRTKVGRSGRAISSGPIIAVATVKGTDERIWFTDRAVHIRGTSKSLVVPHKQLAAATISASDTSLEIDDKNIRFTKASNTSAISSLIRGVKKAVVYQDTGLGEPPPIYQFSGHHDDESQGDWEYVFAVMMGLAVLQALSALPRHGFAVLMQQTGIALFGGLLAITPLLLLGPLAAACGIRASFGRTMTLNAVYSATYAAYLTWVPVLVVALPSESEKSVDIWLSGWTVRIQAQEIAIGAVDTGNLGNEPRVWGALLIAVAAYVIVTARPATRRRQRRQPA